MKKRFLRNIILSGVLICTLFAVSATNSATGIEMCGEEEYQYSEIL